MNPGYTIIVYDDKSFTFFTHIWVVLHTTMASLHLLLETKILLEYLDIHIYIIQIIYLIYVEKDITYIISYI